MVRCGWSCWGRCEYIHVALILAIHGSTSPCKANHTSPPTTDITFLAGGGKEKSRDKKNQKKQQLTDAH